MSGTVLDAEGSLLTPCPGCGAKNRVRVARLTEAPECGRCHAELPPPGEPLAATGPALEALLAASPLPVLVDFWAGWCAPCRSFAPTFAGFAHRVAGRALLVKLDTEAQPAAASRHSVTALPTVIAFRNGTESARQAGAMSAAQLEALVASA